MDCLDCFALLGLLGLFNLSIDVVSGIQPDLKKMYVPRYFNKKKNSKKSGKNIRKKEKVEGLFLPTKVSQVGV